MMLNESLADRAVRRADFTRWGDAYRSVNNGDPPVRLQIADGSWFSFRCDEADGPVAQILARHHDWPGPVKIVPVGDRWQRRLDVYFGDLFSRSDPLADAEVAEREEKTVERLVRGGCRLVRRPAPNCEEEFADDWEAPARDDLARWLSNWGYSVSTAEDGDLRMAITCAGRSANVRVLRGLRRLCFRMLLGQWRDLPSGCEAAMLNLAAEANARYRLVRISWLADGSQRRCEATVDLTGLIHLDEERSGTVSFVEETVLLGVNALELALRSLHRELDVLADPAHEDLATQVFRGRPAKPPRLGRRARRSRVRE
jgi:hypothetical protein